MGAVVAGAIMLVNGGAKARGALLRDVSALGVGVITIAAFLGSGSMSYAKCGILLAEYVAFVFIVLGADLWHIFTRCAGASRCGTYSPEPCPTCGLHTWHALTDILMSKSRTTEESA